jgi:hypothetical protein
MNQKTLSAGDVVDSRCTRCREVTNHTIVAMVGEEVARVQCHVCESVHNYRPEKKKAEKKAASGATKSAAGASRKSQKMKLSADKEEWLALSSTADESKALPYGMNNSYKVNDLVAHPVFGLGVVKLTIKPNKVEILFQEGKKLLRCKL